MMSMRLGLLPSMYRCQFRNLDLSQRSPLSITLPAPKCPFWAKDGSCLVYLSLSASLLPLLKTHSAVSYSFHSIAPILILIYPGVVSYDNKDRFALDGQRLIQIGDTTDSKTEYRFEVEQWARVFALGDDLANPTSWEQHLPDGTIRQFGNTEVTLLLFNLCLKLICLHL